MLSNQTQKYTTETVLVKGMHCASCSATIARKIGKLSGVESCVVNLASEKAVLSYDQTQTSVERMNQEIGKLGYRFLRTTSAHATDAFHEKDS